MKVTWSWTTTLGIMLVAVAGCGNTDHPIREVPKPPFEPRAPADLLIVGSWQLQEITWFKNGIETQRIDYSPIPYILTLEPDGFFHAQYNVPVATVTTQSWLEWIGLEHLQNENIMVTYRGKFQTVNNQLWLNLTSASARPKGAGEIDRDFEDPVFFYHLGDPGPLDYSFSDENYRLQLKREFLTPEGDNLTVKFPHHRLKGA